MDLTEGNAAIVTENFHLAYAVCILFLKNILSLMFKWIFLEIWAAILSVSKSNQFSRKNDGSLSDGEMF